MLYQDFVQKWKKNPTEDTINEFLMNLLYRIQYLNNSSRKIAEKMIASCDEDCKKFSEATEYHFKNFNCASIPVENIKIIHPLGFRYFVPSALNDKIINDFWKSFGWGEFLEVKNLDFYEVEIEII